MVVDPRFVVLLRGVNVGKGNRVAMADFRGLLEAAGFTGVTTLLNSGNAVFSSSGRSASAHAKVIDARLQETFSINVPVIVKPAAEFLASIAGCPIRLGEDLHSRFLVAFGQSDAALQSLSALAPLVEPPEQFHIGRHAAYLYCAHGILESKAGSAVLGKLGRQVTTRNWATVLKLAGMLRG